MADAPLRRVRPSYQTNQAARAWARRAHDHFPFRTRWMIVRHRLQVTWRYWWVDLRYLLRG